MPELKELLSEILTLDSWKEIEKRFVAFRRKAKFVPKKNVLYHLYMSQEVREATVTIVDSQLGGRSWTRTSYGGWCLFIYVVFVFSSRSLLYPVCIYVAENPVRRQDQRRDKCV